MEITMTQKGDAMTGMYERTFVVAVPVAKAWDAFAVREQRAVWMDAQERMADPDSLATFEPSETKIGPAQLHKRLSWSQSHAGLSGWYDTTVTFEEEGSGTRITIVRSGFGDSEDWRHYADSTAGGWDEMIADLIVFLETGVRAGRHFSFRSGLAATSLEAGGGVRITHVIPGGFAQSAGMQAGDLLIGLNGAPVRQKSDVGFCMREHAPGEVIEAEYVRGDRLLRGSGPLSVWNFGTGVYVGHPGNYPKPALTGA